MTPLYLRHEPAEDKYVSKYTDVKDVYAYSDKLATKRVSYWPWHYAAKPKKSHKTIIVNCVRRPVVWLPDLCDCPLCHLT